MEKGKRERERFPFFLPLLHSPVGKPVPVRYTPFPGSSDGTQSALIPLHSGRRLFVAEILVAPKRRNRAAVWIVLVAVIIAVLAWYFLAVSGVTTP